MERAFRCHQDSGPEGPADFSLARRPNSCSCVSLHVGILRRMAHARETRPSACSKIMSEKRRRQRGPRSCSPPLVPRPLEPKTRASRQRTECPSTASARCSRIWERWRRTEYGSRGDGVGVLRADTDHASPATRSGTAQRNAVARIPQFATTQVNTLLHITIRPAGKCGLMFRRHHRHKLIFPPRRFDISHCVDQSVCERSLSLRFSPGAGLQFGG